MQVTLKRSISIILVIVESFKSEMGHSILNGR